MAGIDDERVDRLRASSPSAAALAGLVSTALRVEPALLRHARLRLLPGVDVSAEADLWNSDLLASATANALSFHPGVAQVLRRDLAREAPATRAAALELVAVTHRDHHWSVRLEEAVNALDVEGASDGRERQEQLLLAAVRELRQATAAGGGTADDPVAIARWLLGAYARLAPGAQRGDGATAAALAAGFHLDGRVSAPSPAAADAEAAWLPWLLSAAGAATPSRVRVAFAGSSLRVELDPDGGPTGSATLPPGTMEVPATTPVTIDVATVGVAATITTRLHLQPGQPVTVPLGSDEVLLTTLDGAQHTARRPGAAPASGYDFGARRAELRPCLARDDVTAWLDGVTERDAWWTVVSGPEGIGKSVVMNDAIDRLQRRGVVVAWHFFGVDPAWDDPVALVASLEAQLRAALPAMPPLADEEGPPGGRLSMVLAMAVSVSRQEQRGPLVVVLDGLPDDSADGRSAMWDLPFPSRAPDHVRFLASARRANSVRNWLEDGDPWQMRDLGGEPTEPVCFAMLARAIEGIRLAFGFGGGELTQAAGAERIAAMVGRRVAEEQVEALIARTGANPGRLARLLTWVLAQRPGTVTLDGIPVSLTTDIDKAWARAADVASRAGAPHPDWLGWALVALPRFTLADYRNLEARSSPGRGAVPAQIPAPIEDIPDLVRVSDGLEPGRQQVTPVDPSVLEAFARQFGVAAVIGAHAAHARAILPATVAGVSGYRIRSAVHHYLGAGDVHGAAALLLTPAFARWRWTLGGPGELAGDIDRTIAAGGGGRVVALQALRRAVAAVARHADAVPDLVTSLLVSEYRRQGGPPEDLGPTDEPLPVVLERIVDGGHLGDGWTWPADGAVAGVAPSGVVVVAAAGQLFRFVEGVPEGKTIVDAGLDSAQHLAVSDTGVALAAGDRLVVVGEGQEPVPLATASPVTALIAWEDGFVSGHGDGTVTLHAPTPDGAWRRRIATGHVGPVTALGQHGEWLVSGGADGTLRWWTAGGDAVRTGRRHRAAVRCLATVDDLLGSGDDAGTVVVWPADGRSDTVVPGHHGAVTALVAVGGSLVSAGADGAIRGWDPSAGSRVFRSDGSPVVAAATAGSAPYGVDFVTAETGGSFRWWSLSGPPEVLTQRPIDGAIHQILAGALGVIVVHDGGVTALDPPTSPGDADPPHWRRALATSPDGERVAMGVPDGVVVVSAESGERIGQLTIRRDDRPVALAYAGDDDSDLVLLDGQGRLRLHHAELAGVIGVSVDPDATDELSIVTTAGEVVSVAAAGLTPGMVTTLVDVVTALDRRHGSAVIGTAGGRLFTLTGLGSPNLASDGRKLPAPVPVPVTAVAMTAPFSAVAASADGGLWIWVQGREPVRFGQHPGGVTALAAPNTGVAPIVVSSGTDGLLRVWSIDSGLLVAAIAVPRTVEALAAAGSRIVARTADGELWLLQTQQPPQPEPEPPSSSSAS